LAGKLDREKSFRSGLRIVRAAPWLADLDLKKYSIVTPIFGLDI
jgi:hypothetical protein